MRAVGHCERCLFMLHVRACTLVCKQTDMHVRANTRMCECTHICAASERTHTYVRTSHPYVRTLKQDRKLKIKESNVM